MAIEALDTMQPTEVMVSVGTDHHPFDRLVDWVDQWAADHPTVTVMIQRGTSAPSTHAPSSDLVPYAELLAAFAGARVVVSHGGPSTVMDARKCGRLPIVVPRDPDRGEHVDGHQMRFAAHLHDKGMARMANTKAELFALLDEAMADPDAFSLEVVAETAASGVVEFGAVVDRLLGVATPIERARGER